MIEIKNLAYPGGDLTLGTLEGFPGHRKHKNWESVEYQGKRYQLFGGIRVDYFIDLCNPLKNRKGQLCKVPLRTKDQLIASLDAFTRGYLECMFWCGHPLGESDTDNDKSLDELGLFVRDLTKASLRAIMADCSDFQTAHDNPGMLAEWYALGRDEAHSGHDFWLTRNRHGAGFWDRYSSGRGKELGELLTAMAHPYGEVNLYLFRGRIHVS